MKKFVIISLLIFICCSFLIVFMADPVVAENSEVTIVGGLENLNPLNKDIFNKATGEEQLAFGIGLGIRALLILVGAFAFFMFVYGGVFILTAAGEESKITKGKRIIEWAVIGLIIVLSAYALTDLVISSFSGGDLASSGSSGSFDIYSIDTTKSCEDQGGICISSGCALDADFSTCINDFIEDEKRVLDKDCYYKFSADGSTICAQETYVCCENK